MNELSQIIKSYVVTKADCTYIPTFCLCICEVNVFSVHEAVTKLCCVVQTHDSVKDWQDGLRALLPNINISFGAVQPSQQPPLLHSPSAEVPNNIPPQKGTLADSP